MKNGTTARRCIPFLWLTRSLHRSELLGFYWRHVVVSLFHTTHQVRSYVRKEGWQQVCSESLQPYPHPLLSSPAHNRGPSHALSVRHVVPRSRAQGTGTPPPQRWCHSEGLGDAHREQLHMPVLARTVHPLTPFLLIATKDSRIVHLVCMQPNNYIMYLFRLIL